MIRGSFMLTSIFWLGLAKVSFGQVADVKERNIRHLDSMRHLIEIFCEDKAIYKEPYEKKSVRTAIRTIELLNCLAENDVKPNKVDSIVSGIKFGRVIKEVKPNGELQVVTVRIFIKYLSAAVQLIYLDQRPITRKIEIYPVLKVKCRGLGYGMADLKLFRDVLVDHIAYPIRVVDYEKLVMKKIDLDLLAQDSIRDGRYKTFSNYFSDSTKDWAYGFLRNQYDPDDRDLYSYAWGDESLVRLIKEGRFSLIRDLVFSPNYFYAINAMETVIYLASVGKIELDAELNTRISELKTGDSEIRVERSSDVTSVHNGYGTLHVTDADVIRKYGNSVRR